MKKSNRNFIKTISKLMAFILLFSLFVPIIYQNEVIAETTKQNTSDSDKAIKKPRGFKIEGATLHEELWDKYRVIAGDNGGGSGEGGGANGDMARTAGNGGTGENTGGIGGNVGGTGLGTGDPGNSGVGGAKSGSGSAAGKTGSDMLDKIREEKQEMEESRNESISQLISEIESSVLAEPQEPVETTLSIRESVMESIEERERMQASIQKEIAKESLKAKLNEPKTNVIVPEETFEMQTQEVSPVVIEPVVEPVKPSIIISGQIQPEVYETMPIEPTIEPTIEDITEPTYDAPIIEASYETTEYNETTIVEQELETYPTTELETQPTTETTKEEETETTKNEEEESQNEKEDEELVKDTKDDGDKGTGSKGGNDPSLENDNKGNDATSESKGYAEDDGQYQSEVTGKHRGKKVLEIDRNGFIGIDENKTRLTDANILMKIGLSFIFGIGILLYFVFTRDKKSKRSYF